MLIILSGGMDSTTLAYEFKDVITHALSFHYGSKHNDKEIEFAKLHAKKLGLKHEVIYLDFINKYFDSDLLKSGGNIPEGHYEDESMKRTVVPFRNGIMLAIATGYAESKGLDGIYIGNHFGDHAIYPDCRKPFINGMEEAMKEGTYKKVKLFSPYVAIDKREIGLKGKELGIEYEKTWTCYKGQDIHCGVCGSCSERKEALEGFDPTIYNE